MFERLELIHANSFENPHDDLMDIADNIYSDNTK